MKKQKGYFRNIWEGIRTSVVGLRLSIRHAWQANKRRKSTPIFDAKYFEQKTGIVTLEYPFEAIAVPDNGRYRLYNEMEDCIVCDKCAKICPVDCIEIEAIKSPEQIGTTSDGSPIRLYAQKFDIDMAKCCYCGLCTTVCPTECLTMTKAYDYSEYDIRNMIYNFSNLTPEQSEEKIALWEQYQKEKEQAKKTKEAVPTEEKEIKATETGVIKPKFKPKIQPKKEVEKTEDLETSADIEKPQPVFKPKVKIKPIIPKKDPQDPNNHD
jgi:formate hydrogenlyase subunit 6/NADH:ubiquinone oxidoreductase subunit I